MERPIVVLLEQVFDDLGKVGSRADLGRKLAATVVIGIDVGGSDKY